MAMPIKKASAGRDHVKSGAPAPGAEHSPPQDQKGMNGSNAAPPNQGGGMPVKKPSAGRSVSMPKHAAKSGGKEAPPASTGGKVGSSRAGESAQPMTAQVAPDMAGGAPSAGTTPAGAPSDGGMGGDPLAMIQALLAHAQQSGGQLPPELTTSLPPELMAMLQAAMQGGGGAAPEGMAGNPQLQPQVADANAGDLIRRMMLQSGQMQPPQQVMGQVKV